VLYISQNTRVPFKAIASFSDVVKTVKMAMFGLCFGATLLTVPSDRAHATPIFFDMVLTGASGPDAGAVGSGSFSIESTLFDGVGVDVYSASDGSIISFDVDFNGDSFSISDATGFPSSPNITFTDGAITQINYATVCFGCIGLGIDNFTYFNGTDTTPTQGPMTITRSVPEPGTLALFGIGLAGLGAMRRRRKAA
jgi:hypothetical protein